MKRITKKQVESLRAIQIAAHRAMREEGIYAPSLPRPVKEYIRLANLAMTVLEDAISR